MADLVRKDTRPRVGKREATGENRAKPEAMVVKRGMVANYIADMAMGLTQREVALKYKTTIDHVRKMLHWAEKENLFAKAQDAIDNRLVPKAIDLLEKSLENAIRKAVENGTSDEWEVAERILKGVKLLDSGRGTQKMIVASGDGEGFDEFSYEKFVARRGQTADPFSPEGDSESGYGGEPEPAIDAEIVLPAPGETSTPSSSGDSRPDPDGAPPSAGAEDGPKGDGE